MKLLQLLLTSIFIFIRVEHYYAYPVKNGNNESPTKSSIESSTEDNLYLPDIVPEHYKIQLELAAEEDMFYGTSEVNITIKNPTSFIYLHSKELENITNTFIMTKPDTFHDNIKHFVQRYKYMKEMEIIVLYFDYELSPGEYILNINFTSIIGNNIGGFFKTSYNGKDPEWLIATRTWTMGARRMFPCWDKPNFQAKFTITIKYHAKYLAFSNMPISTSKTVHDTAITSFHTTPAISTHLIAIVLCDFPTTIENYNWRGRSQSVRNQRFASLIAKTVTSYFEINWKELHTFSDVQHLAIPGLLDDGMAKWALILYREEDIIYDEELDSEGQFIKMISLIGRKISRQWLSTVVSPSSWSYMWLNEGIATFFYIEDVVKERLSSEYSDLFVIQTMQESLHLDVLSIMSPLISETDRFSDINSIFSLSYYLKAPLIIRMLQRILGDKVFRNGINTYFKRQSASLNNFWTDMQTAYEEELLEILPTNIKKVMDPWIEQKSFPVLVIQVGGDYINITNDGDWMVPLTNTTQKYLDFNDTPTIKWLNSGKNYHMLIGTKLCLKDTWVIFNIRQTGYYRVNYNDENWLKIARYLNSKNYKKIHVLNRAQIIDDAFHLMIANQLKFSIFSDLSKYLSQETDYKAWYPMIKALEYLSYLFPFSKRQPFKVVILNQLRSLLDKIEYKEKSEDDDFTKCLRQEAVKWECVLGDFECKTEAVTKLKWHLENPKNNTLLPWWRKWTYCDGLAVADDVTLWFYMKTFIDEKDTKMFEFLACSNKIIFILRTFIAMKSNPNNRYFLISKNYIDLFHYIVMRHARNDTIFDYILNNWDITKPKEISTITALISIINNVYSEKQLDKIMMFVKNIKEILLTISVPPVLRNSLESRTQNCTECAKMVIDKIIQFQICSIQTKVNIRLSQIKRHMDSCGTMCV